MFSYKAKAGYTPNTKFWYSSCTKGMWTREQKYKYRVGNAMLQSNLISHFPLLLFIVIISHHMTHEYDTCRNEVLTNVAIFSNINAF